MPGGTFLGAGVKTVVLFFTKGELTKNIWYYQLQPGRNMGKGNPLNDEDMKEFIALQKTKPETEKSWNVYVGLDDELHNVVRGALPRAIDIAPFQSDDTATAKPQRGATPQPGATPYAIGSNYDLGVKNPNAPEEAALRSPQEILEEMQLLNEETNEILSTIKELI